MNLGRKRNEKQIDANALSRYGGSNAYLKPYCLCTRYYTNCRTRCTCSYYRTGRTRCTRSYYRTGCTRCYYRTRRTRSYYCTRC
jgi:hypothetical protein